MYCKHGVDPDKMDCKRCAGEKEAIKNLRDQFAIAAITGIYARPETFKTSGTPETFSKLAYQVAGAMLKARKGDHNA